VQRSEARARFFQHILAAVRRAGRAAITYRTEWNGLDIVMPMDHWIECAGERIDFAEVAWAWGAEDLEALEAAGALRAVRRWENPQDRFDTATDYEVVLPEKEGG
jgi:hypothetical protein